jgi:outer membrane lipopolysaccharide assembly protein LptE/RlpB
MLIPNFMAKVLRTPNSQLRTCSRLILITWVTLLLSCGYQLVGKETHIPSGLTSVAIPTFANLTYEPGIEVPFTRGFLTEFIQDRRVKVVDRSEADSILEGVIKSLQIYSVAYDRSGLATEYQTTVVIDLTLRKRTGEVLWTEKDISDSRWYKAYSGVLSSEFSKDTAIQQIGRFVAERARNRFFHNF